VKGEVQWPTGLRPCSPLGKPSAGACPLAGPSASPRRHATPPAAPPSFTHLVTSPSSPSKQSGRTSAILVHARRGTASRQSSPTPPPPPPLPRSPLRQADQAKVRANFTGSVVTVAGRPRRSWSSPWPAIIGPLSPLFSIPLASP
jgi:hypothetical protein